MSRINCCVPFCKRTRKPINDATEWICGDHWKIVRKNRRRVYGRHKKRWRRFGPEWTADKYLFCRRIRRLWNSLKREAIERAAGL